MPWEGKFSNQNTYSLTTKRDLHRAEARLLRLRSGHTILKSHFFVNSQRALLLTKPTNNDIFLCSLQSFWGWFLAFTEMLETALRGGLFTNHDSVRIP